MIVHQLPRGRIHEGDWLQADLAPGYDLAIVDGPYAMGIAPWDRMKLDDLAEWYTPHVARLTSLMAPSASVYLWNTAAGLKRLDPVMRAAGWTWRADITWDKGLGAMAGKIDTAAMRTWFDVTEVCGFYQREGFDISAMARGVVYRDLDEQRCAIGAAVFLTSERERAGMSRREVAAYFPSKTGGLTGCVTNWEEGYNFPTWEAWARLHTALNTRAGGPYLQRDTSRMYDYEALRSDYEALRSEYEALRSEYEALRSEYEALRSEYEALRAPFTLPPGVTNVWSAPIVSGADRLKGEDGAALHPCQKRLDHVERMIRASTRPGGRVIAPFGGTCREAVVCEWLARVEPDEARSYDVCELNQDDGRDYVSAALAQIRGEDVRRRPVGQVRLFAGGAA